MWEQDPVQDQDEPDELSTITYGLNIKLESEPPRETHQETETIKNDTEKQNTNDTDGIQNDDNKTQEIKNDTGNNQTGEMKNGTENNTEVITNKTDGPTNEAHGVTNDDGRISNDEHATKEGIRNDTKGISIPAAVPGPSHGSQNQSTPLPSIATKAEMMDDAEFENTAGDSSNKNNGVCTQIKRELSKTGGISKKKIKKEKPRKPRYLERQKHVGVKKMEKAASKPTAGSAKKELTSTIPNIESEIDGVGEDSQINQNATGSSPSTEISDEHMRDSDQIYVPDEEATDSEEEERGAAENENQSLHLDAVFDDVLGQVVASRVMDGSDARPFQCDICHKVMRNGASLTQHLQTHQNERNWRCDICDKTYKSSSSLAGHLKTCHTDERPFSCHICSKTFPRQNSLNRHLMTHTGEKPFACTVCDKRFPQNSYLKAHMRNHTGEKPYKCPECGESFKHSGYLMDHRRRIHTGEKRHGCGVCGKLFTRASDKLRHERTHEQPGEGSIRQFKCDNCGIRYKFRDKLQRHMQEGKCRLTYRMDRAKPSPSKTKMKIKMASVQTKPNQRKQLKPKKVKIKNQDTESVQSDSSLVSRKPPKSKTRKTRRRAVPSARHGTPLVYFEDDDPPKPTTTTTPSKSPQNAESFKYVCETCGERFETSAILVEHTKSHRKPFRCLTCNLSYGWSLELVKHTNGHAERGEAYVYEIYGKQFMKEGKK